MSQIRRKYWEVFYYIHVVFTKVVYLLGVLHLQAHPIGLALMALPLVVWLVERLNRCFGAKAHSSSTFTCTRAKVDATTTHLVFNTGSKIICTNPGDYCFLSFPAVSKMERHPFSIASAPGIHSIEFRMKNMGPDSFTGKLYKHVQTLMKPEDLEINVTGPYGKMSINLLNPKYKTIILCAGGIGITPMISTLHWLHDQYTAGKLKHVEKVLFIWTVRYEKELVWANDIIQKMSVSSDVFVTQLYVTRPEGKQRVKSLVEGSGDIELVTTRSSQVVPDSAGAWEEHTNEADGKSYFYNVKTKETTWDRPAEMEPHDQWDLDNTKSSEATTTTYVADAVESPQDWTQGRPKYAKIFALSPEYSKDRTCVLACGPAPMVKDVESTAAAKELDFHKEIFAF